VDLKARINQAIDDWWNDPDGIMEADWWTEEEARINAETMKEAIAEVFEGEE